MKVEITEKSENPLLERTEIKFKADHAGGPTPRRPDVRAQLAALLGTAEELLVIDKLASTHGHQVASGIARAYRSREQLERLEPKHLLNRGLPKEAKPEKPAEAKPERPKEAEPEKPKAEKAEKPPEEKPKEAKPEKPKKPAPSPEETKPEEKEVREKPKEEAKGGKGG